MHKYMKILKLLALAIIGYFAFILIDHTIQIQHQDRLIQCHNSNGILMQEAFSGQYYCISKDRIPK